MKSTTKRIAMIVLILVMSIMSALPVSAKTRIKLSKTSITMNPAQTKVIKLKGTSKKAKWTSSNKKVATVNNGRITARKAGRAVITAKLGNKKYKCKVTVKVKKAPKVYRGSYSKDNIKIYATINPNKTCNVRIYNNSRNDISLFNALSSSLNIRTNKNVHRFSTPNIGFGDDLNYFEIPAGGNRSYTYNIRSIEGVPKEIIIKNISVQDENGLIQFNGFPNSGFKTITAKIKVK